MKRKNQQKTESPKKQQKISFKKRKNKFPN